MANISKPQATGNPAPTNDFERALVERHAYTGYKDLFQSVYEASGIAMIAALAFSAFLSSKFYASWFGALGSGAIFIGGLIACGVAYFIYDLHSKAIKYRHAQRRNEPVLTALLWGLVALSVYADLAGGAEWGAELTGGAPTDTKTSELGGIYGPQIEAINAEIEGIEAREFHWCGTHNTAHKCPQAQFYIDPKRDKKHVARIEELKAQRAELQSTMNGLLADAGAQHSQATSHHYDRLERNQGAMRGAGIVAVVFALLVGYWRHGYEAKAVGEILAPAPTPEPEYTDDDMTEAERALEELAKENRALREEREALREAMERNATPPTQTPPKP